MSITDKNWLEKLFIKEAKAAKDYHNRGGSGGCGGGGRGVTDVTELPTENVDGNAVYRVSIDADEGWAMYGTTDT